MIADVDALVNELIGLLVDFFLLDLHLLAISRLNHFSFVVVELFLFKFQGF